MEKKRVLWLPLLLLLVMLVFIIILVVDLIPILQQVVADRSDETQMVRYVEAYGAKGAFLIIGLQALQVIVTVLPAAAVQVLAGLCYGVWLGTALCLVGYVIGNVLVFVALRQFGRVLGPLITWRPRRKKKAGKAPRFDVKRLTRMENPQRAAFALYLIPFIPNGVLPYVFASSKITFRQYIVAVVVGSIPSTLLCAWLGDNLSAGNWKMALVVVGVVLALAVLAYIFKDKLMQRLGRVPARQHAEP